MKQLFERIDTAYRTWTLLEQDWRRQGTKRAKDSKDYKPDAPILVDPIDIHERNAALLCCRGPCVGRKAYEAGQDYQPPMWWSSDMPIGPPDDIGNPHSHKHAGVRPWTENEVMQGLMNKGSGKLAEIAKKSPVIAAYERNYGSYSEESLDEAIQLGATNAWIALPRDEARINTRFTAWIGSYAEEGMKSGVPPGFRNEFRVARGLLGRFDDIGHRLLRQVREGKPLDQAAIGRLQTYVDGIDPEAGPHNKSQVPVAVVLQAQEAGPKAPEDAEDAPAPQQPKGRAADEMKEASLGILAPVCREVGIRLLRAAGEGNEQALMSALDLLKQKTREIKEKEETYSSRGPNLGGVVAHPKESVPSATNLAKALPREIEYPISMGELADTASKLKVGKTVKRLFDKAIARVRQYPTTLGAVRDVVAGRPDAGRGTAREVEILASGKRDLQIDSAGDLAEIIEKLAAAQTADRELDILRSADPDVILKSPEDTVKQLAVARERYIKGLKDDPIRNVQPLMVTNKESDRESEPLHQFSPSAQLRTLAYREVMKKAVHVMRSGRGRGKGWAAKLANDALGRVEKAIAASRDQKTAAAADEYQVKRREGDQPNFDLFNSAGEVVASGFDTESEALQRANELTRNPALPTLLSVIDSVSSAYGEYAPEIRDVCKQLAYAINTGDEEELRAAEEELLDLKQVAAEDVAKFKTKPEVGSTVSQQAYRVFIRFIGMDDYPERGTVDDPEIDADGSLSAWAKAGFPQLIVPDIANEFGVSVMRIKQLKEKAQEVIEPIAQQLQNEAVDDFDRRIIYEARVANARSFLLSKLGPEILHEYACSCGVVD